MIFVVFGSLGLREVDPDQARARPARPDVRFSVSHTTRPRRETEAEGRDYYFVDPPRFRADDPAARLPRVGRRPRPAITGRLEAEMRQGEGRRRDPGYRRSGRPAGQEARGVGAVFDLRLPPELRGPQGPPRWARTGQPARRSPSGSRPPDGRSRDYPNSLTWLSTTI